MYKQDFPIFKHRDIVYLDSASTTQKPGVVIDALSNFYTMTNANVHRATYALGAEATKAYEASRAAVGRFLGAAPEEIVFTKNATEGINLVAHAWAYENLKRGDEIILSIFEQHGNLLPWYELARAKGLTIRVWKPNKKGILSLETFRVLLTKRTRLVALTYVSNALGTVLPIEAVSEILKTTRAAFLVDAVQAAAHISLDVARLGCDFLVLSAHKMYGPTGIGALYINKRRFSEMKPFLLGGSMVQDIKGTKATYVAPPHRFEAGTPPIAEAVAFKAAIEYLNRVGFSAICAHEDGLLAELFDRLSVFPFIQVHSSRENNPGIVSFSLEGMHPHDVATILEREGIAVRAGHHCAIPLHTFLRVPATVRVSLGIYNDVNDVSRLCEALARSQKILSL